MVPACSLFRVPFRQTEEETGPRAESKGKIIFLQKNGNRGAQPAVKFSDQSVQSPQ